MEFLFTDFLLVVFNLFIICSNKIKLDNFKTQILFLHKSLHCFAFVFVNLVSKVAMHQTI